MDTKKPRQRRHAGMTGGQVAIVAMFGIAIFAILIIGAILLLEQPAAYPAVAQAQTVQGQPVQASATMQPQSRPTFPPTWTPTTTPLPTVTRTVTPIPSPTATRTPSATPTPSATFTRTPRPTQANFELLKTLAGMGNGTTEPLALQAGHVRVDWSYNGPKTAGGISATEQQYHAQLLQTYYDWYQRWTNYYSQLKEKAIADRDALHLEDIQQQLNDVANTYNQKVEQENQRYASLVPSPGTDNTPFNLAYTDPALGAVNSIAAHLGTGSGQAFFESNGGRTVFQVQATGNWTLNVYYKP